MPVPGSIRGFLKFKPVFVALPLFIEPDKIVRLQTHFFGIEHWRSDRLFRGVSLSHISKAYEGGPSASRRGLPIFNERVVSGRVVVLRHEE